MISPTAGASDQVALGQPLLRRTVTDSSAAEQSHLSRHEGNAASDRKRKSSEPNTPSSRTSTQRQKITRACDLCKEKKTRCNGTLPCMRCTRLSLPCEYTAAYSRGLPPEPPPAPPSVLKQAPGPGPTRGRSSNSVSRHSATGSTAVQPQCQASRPGLPASPRHSPQPVATDFEGNYLGPASGVSFINRVWGRLHQDESAAIPDEVQDTPSRNTSVFKFGDTPYAEHERANFTLPPFARALEMIGSYFDFTIVTYRFLHRPSVEEWLHQIYKENVSFDRLPTGSMVARTSIVFMIFAVTSLYEERQPGAPFYGRNDSEKWYTASKYFSSLETGPPRLETIQARLGQCLYLLSSSRANECWYTFGTALQLVTAMGIHRKWPAKLSKNGDSYLEQELRKRIFWSAYTLDKYLSLMFGRPRLLHDEDMDQELPHEISDEDLSQEDPERRIGPVDCLMTASVLHFRLGRILGEISRQLYTIKPLSRGSPLETAVRLTSELEKWKASAPPVFNGVQASSLIPPLRRQSQVLQLAYSHAMIHATRSFLLNDFTDLNRRPPVPNPIVAAHVRKCINAAEDVLTLVNRLGTDGVLVESFWFTHYVCFCAIIVIYIYTIQQFRLHSKLDASMRRLFDLAESCQQHLAEATRKNCPSRRYSIILEELRLEVHRQVGEILQSSPLADVSERNTPNLRHYPEASFTERYYASAGGTSVEMPSLRSTNYMTMAAGDTNLSSPMPPADFAAGFDTSQDLAVLDNLDGSIWWAQLDSWAFSNLPTDPSNFTFQ